LALGISVRRAQAEIDSAEFSEWMAYYRFDPFGGERGDLQAARVSLTVAGAFRGKGRRPKLSDFMLDFDSGMRRQTDEEIEAVFNAVQKVHNSTVRNKQ